jgi:hypothetical protein
MDRRDSSPTPKVLYVCSAARSGSTVLDMFLGSHPQAASLGEINLLGKSLKWGHLCTCGVPLAACPSWAKVFDSIKRSSGIDFRSDPYAYRLWIARARREVDRDHQNWTFELSYKLSKAYLLLRAATPRSLRFLAPLPVTFGKALQNKMHLYSTIADCWGKQVVVDSSKSSWEAIELARRWPQQVKVVLLFRDGRGVYQSRRNTGIPRKTSVMAWSTYYRRAVPLLRREVDPGSLMELRYEEFASAPEVAGRRLCDFIGLEYEPRMADLGAADRHMAGGNNTRFKPQKGIQLDEGWRTALAGEELAYFERHGGALNASLGYR